MQPYEFDDVRFRSYVLPNAPLMKLADGFAWLEGPVWFADHGSLIVSDLPNDRLLRWSEDGGMSVFRAPSAFTNGNTRDHPGRLISCSHQHRCILRTEWDGGVTVLADRYRGKRLNSPNDVICRSDGSIWFTDPPYGTNLSEGHPDIAGGPGNPDGILDPALGDIGVGLIGRMKREAPVATYRWDPSGRLDRVVPFEQAPTPNGICFSPDYRILYLINAGKVFAFDLKDGKAANMRVFTDCMVDGVRCGPDGMRADRAGNIWVSSNAPLGYSGVTIWSPAGELLGRIRLPEACANICFAGPKRDWLFMCASQSVYMLRVNIQGASPG